MQPTNQPREETIKSAKLGLIVFRHLNILIPACPVSSSTHLFSDHRIAILLTSFPAVYNWLYSHYPVFSNYTDIMASALRSAAVRGRRGALYLPSMTRAFVSSPRLSSESNPFFPNEPPVPIVKTSTFPATNNKVAADELSEVFDLRSMNMMADYDASIGNLYDTLHGTHPFFDFLFSPHNHYLTPWCQTVLPIWMVTYS